MAIPVLLCKGECGLQRDTDTVRNQCTRCKYRIEMNLEGIYSEINGCRDKWKEHVEYVLREMLQR